MFPSNTSKNTMEFVSEMNRLFARNNDFDYNSPMTSSSSHSFSRSIIPSSSSTETSPESFPETNQRVPEMFQPNYQKRPEYFEQREHIPQRNENFIQRPHYFDQRLDFCRPEDRHGLIEDNCEETPFIIRRQRPIIGRKIMATTETLPKIEEKDMFWSSAELAQQTPPKSSSYELFPAENKPYEFRTPVKTSPPTFTSSPISPVSISPLPRSPQSPKLTQIPKPMFVPMSPIVSPTMLPNSPKLPHNSMRLLQNSPKLVQNSIKLLQNSPKLEQNSMKVAQSPIMNPLAQSPFPQGFLFQNKPSMSQNCQNLQVTMCTFCRKNGETPLVYMAHAVKEKIGNKNVVTCPILRRHVCQTCGASGDNAHTITYCPVLRSNNNGQPLRSTTITLKNTRVKSNGRRRF